MFTDPWNLTETPERKPHNHSQLIFNKGTKTIK